MTFYEREILLMLSLNDLKLYIFLLKISREKKKKVFELEFSILNELFKLNNVIQL